MKTYTTQKTVFQTETYCPCFTGFYETLLSTFDDDYIEQSWNDDYIYELTKNEDLTNKIVEYINNNYTNYFNYKDLHESISKKVVEFINENHNFDKECIFNMEFQNLYSPKFYNYSTDSINTLLKFDINMINELKIFINDNIEDFQDYIVGRYTSCSGFISYYSNNHLEWLKHLDNIELLQKKGHYIGTFLEFYYDNLHNDVKMDIYYYCHEYFLSNGNIENYFNYDKMYSDIKENIGVDLRVLED